MEKNFQVWKTYFPAVENEIPCCGKKIATAGDSLVREDMKNINSVFHQQPAYKICGCKPEKNGK